MYSYASLKQQHRNLRSGFDEPFSIRIHRSLSWLDRAEKEIDDPDAGFIFYWISFNANYSMERENPAEFNETKCFQEFFGYAINGEC